MRRAAGEMAALGEVPFAHYYGSVDATPLFVLLAAAYYARTGDLELIRRDLAPYPGGARLDAASRRSPMATAFSNMTANRRTG